MLDAEGEVWMIYFKTAGTEYPASIAGKVADREWEGRTSKAITLEMTYAAAAQLFQQGLAWSIVQRELVPEYDAAGVETGRQSMYEREWDNREYCVPGPITDHRDGTITVKMGKLTQLEKQLQEIREVLA